MPAVNAGGSAVAVPVSLASNVQTTLGTAPVSGVSQVGLSFDRTVSGGLNSAGTAASVTLTVWANAGQGFYPIAACTVAGGGTTSVAELAASTYQPEIASMITATMTGAASVSITPALAVT